MEAASSNATPATITLGGRTLQAAKLGVEHYREIEQALLAKRPNPFALARDNAALFADQPAMQNMLLEEAMKHALAGNKYVSRTEVNQWLGTIEGIQFYAWLRVRDNGPEFTLDYVRGLMEAEVSMALQAAAEKQRAAAAEQGDAPASAA